MKKLIFIAALALAGCANEAEKAEDAFYEARSAGASESELCRAAKRIGQDYADAEDFASAETWNGVAQAHCSLAYFKEGYRY